MEKKNPEVESRARIYLIIFAVLLAAVIAVLVIRGKNNTASENGVSESGESMTVEEKVYTPTFMMFVTKNDENYDEYMAVIEEVKTEYEGKVNFDITDIEEESDAKDNFGDIIALGTPTLIMLNTKNEPCAFVGKCSDKQQMVNNIETALKSE
ncbi:MAG: hypothetical protein IJH94_05420 [Clostridia bacterium]|nr:hypothetical protein [Clostridia bacterium]